MIFCINYLVYFKLNVERSIIWPGSRDSIFTGIMFMQKMPICLHMCKNDINAAIYLCNLHACQGNWLIVDVKKSYVKLSLLVQDNQIPYLRNV